MANIITGRITNMIEVGTFAYNDGSIEKKVEIWLMPCYFDRYTGEMKFPENHGEMLNILCSGRMADVINEYKIDSVVTITYELYGRKVKNKHTGEEKVYNNIEARHIDPFPKARL